MCQPGLLEQLATRGAGVMHRLLRANPAPAPPPTPAPAPPPTPAPTPAPAPASSLAGGLLSCSSTRRRLGAACLAVAVAALSYTLVRELQRAAQGERCSSPPPSPSPSPSTLTLTLAPPLTRRGPAGRAQPTPPCQRRLPAYLHVDSAGLGLPRQGSAQADQPGRARPRPRTGRF